MPGEAQKDLTLEKVGSASEREPLDPSDMKTSCTHSLSPEDMRARLHPCFLVSFLPLSPTLSLGLARNPRCPGRGVGLLQLLLPWGLRASEVALSLRYR